MATDSTTAAQSAMPAPASDAPANAKPNKMLDAWYDPLAQCKAFSQNIQMCDIEASGENKLLLACNDRRLRVLSGSRVVSEHILLDDPAAMCVFYTDNRRPHTPAVAVAGGRYVFIYRNLRPYFKFSLPSLPVADAEVKVWQQVKAGEITVAEATEELGKARDSGVELTIRSAELLAQDTIAQAEEYANLHMNDKLQRNTVITTMSVLNKDSASIGSVGCLVIGTEAREVMILSPSGSSILKKCKLPAVPTKLVVSGLLDVDYRILASCRDGRVYTLRNLDSVSAMNLEVSGSKIELDSHVVGLVNVSRNAIVGCMNRAIHCYHHKGKKMWSLYMPDDIICMEQMEVAMVSIIRALVVALKNGEVRIYHNKRMVIKIPPRDPENPDPVLGLKFGRYGREDGCLVMTHVSGAVTIKILPRRTNFNVTSNVGPPPEQDIPLKVPKKTRLYVEQTARERDQATTMHRKFQRELCRLRLETARSYVKLITDGQGPSTFMSGANVRINASVVGLGPAFQLKVQVRNSGTKSVAGLWLMLVYNRALYTVDPGTMMVPLLLPGQVYHLTINMTCVDPMAGAAPVHLFMTRPTSAIPVLSAVIDMPTSLEGEEAT